MNKILALCLALVIATGVSGIGYAAWYDVMTINTEIATGTVAWSVGMPTLLDPKPATRDYTCGVGFINIRQTDTNVGYGEASRLQLDAVFNEISVSLTNASPCYYNRVNFFVFNQGTLPTRLDRIILSYTDTGGTPRTVNLPANQIVNFDFNLDAKNDFEARWDLSGSSQVDPGNSIMAQVAIHALPDFPPAWPFTFKLMPDVIQWNAPTQP